VGDTIAAIFARETERADPDLPLRWWQIALVVSVLGVVIGYMLPWKI